MSQEILKNAESKIDCIIHIFKTNKHSLECKVYPKNVTVERWCVLETDVLKTMIKPNDTVLPVLQLLPILLELYW